MEQKFAEYPPGHIYELTRHLFFSDLKRVAPEIINELEREPLDRCTGYCRAFVASEISRRDFFSVDPNVSALYAEFEHVLREWLKRHGLNEAVWRDNLDWMFEIAREYVIAHLDPELKLLYEQYNPMRRRFKEILEAFEDLHSDTREKFLSEKIEIEVSPGTTAYAQRWPELIFRSYGWNPFEEERSEAIGKLMGEFKVYLEKYLDEMEAACRMRNIHPVPVAFRRKQNVERFRFEWLIRFHVQGWTKSKIAREYRVNRKAVQVSIAKEAEWIGLIPRQ